MREIEKKMCEAVKNRTWFKGNNTMVETYSNGWTFVLLFGNCIFAKDKKGREYFSDHGWHTVTTSSRLRALGADYSTNEKKNNCKLTAGAKLEGFRYNAIFNF